MAMPPRLLPALARFAFFAAALAILVLANMPDPPQIPGLLNDKAQHALAFIVLAGLAIVAWPSAAMWKILVSLGAFGALIELIQDTAELGRDSSLGDWFADITAIALALILAGVIKRLSRRKPAAATAARGKP